MISSPYYEARQIEDNNRGLFSKKQIKPWETCVQTQPLCLAVGVSMRHMFCNWCLQETKVERCAQCKVIYYCSKQCQREDWSVHKSECKVYSKLVVDKKIAPTRITTEFILNLKLYFLCLKNQEIGRKLEEMCSFIDYQLPQKLTHYQETAVVLIENLGIEKSQQNLSKFIKQQCSVALNCFTIQDYLCNYESVGLGLYWPANYINHHCHPNCTQIFDGRTLKIVANRQIEVGEEITISYVPRLQGWESRVKILKEGYLFQCFCQICLANKMFDENLIHLICPSCSQCAIGRKKQIANETEDIDGEKGNQEEKAGPQSANVFCCLKCKTSVQASQINEQIVKANNLMEKISSDKNNYTANKKFLIELRKILSMSCPKFESCLHKIYLQSLDSACDNPEIYKESYILLKQMVETIPKWYGLNNEDQIPYVYAWRFAELGKLAYNLNKLKKACEYTEKSYRIIESIGFKGKFMEVGELKQRYQEMKIGLSFNKAELFKS